MRRKDEPAMASIQDVAKAAGVSPITVSRVMRDGTNVRPATRDRVLRAAADLNYVPNAVARSLRQARSGLLALIITDMMNPLFYAMARGAEAAAQAAGIAVVLGNSDDDAALEAKYLRVMAEHRVDGIILVPTPSTTGAHFPPLPDKVPLVLLDRRPPDLAASLVCCDSGSATRDLCRHLFALGHERIAIVGGMPEVSTWRERVDGYRRALREARRPSRDEIVLHGDYRADGGRAAVRTLLAMTKPPDAIVAASAQVLYGVLDALAALGKTVPGDVSVSCLDDPALPSFVRPRFTYVAQPGYEMGAAAVAAVLAVLEANETTAADRVFPASLRFGESCREQWPANADAADAPASLRAAV
ncbi:MAG TPA: LacI family DNA-binding transcriptional regulator [Thermomicrobiales bacterium]|nr:LacI family DNA-binding transcriptional regulator [Thermomicrobiales bacterium]